MNTLIINSAKIAKNTTTAHSRNAIEISRKLNIKLVSTIEELIVLNRHDYDCFVIIGAAFYPKTAEIDQWIRNGNINQVCWINNEYQVSPNSEYARLFKDFNSLLISNVQDKESNKCNKAFNKFLSININTLLFDCKKRSIQKKYELIYYGTYRSNRRLYLQKYFYKSDFHISSSSKNIRKFHQLSACNAKFCDKLSWEDGKESLNLFKYSLYIEDELTHDNFNYLANRFYECLKCNVVLFFEESCKNTFEKSGYPILDKYFVSSKEELEKKVAKFNFNECLSEQQKAWSRLANLEKKEVLECLSQHLTND